MSTILPATVNILRHEGDYADISVILPTIISVADVSNVQFHVKDSFGNMLIEQNEGNTYIRTDAEKNSIIIPLKLKDGTLTTKGKAGEHNYEVEVNYNGNPQTLLRGKIRIQKEVII